MDSRTNYLARGLQYDVDTASLRARILRLMLPLSRRKALKLLEQEPPVSPPPLTCSQAWRWSVDEFYGSLASVAKSSLTQRDIASGRRTALLSSYGLAITSAYQLGPAAKLLQDAGLNSSELRELLETFADSIKSLRDSDRAITLGVLTGAPNFVNLYRYCVQHHVSVSVVFSALRDLIVANSAGPRCSKVQPVSRSALWVPADSFNHMLALTDLRDIEPLTSEELRTSLPPGPRAVPEEVTVSSTQTQLQAQVQKLMWATDRSEDPAAWDLTFSDIVNQVGSAIDKSASDDHDLFSFQCNFFTTMIEKAPTLQDRQSVIKTYARLLSNSEVLQMSPPEWLWHLQALLEATHLTSEGGRPANQDVLTLSQNSNPVMMAYLLVQQHKQDSPHQVNQ